MDSVSDPFVDHTVVKKSAQVGWTEIINNIVGYFIDQDAAPMLVLQPTLAMGEAWSKDRLSPMIRDTACLTSKVGDSKSRDSGSTILHKKFAGGHLTVAGANSPASLASRPIRVVLADEIDRYPISAGSEGDPLGLAHKRANNFWNRRKLSGSTPTTAGISRIDAAWELSDKRHFYVPCPACSEMQVLRWEQVKWDKGDDGAHLYQTAYYLCGECGHPWDDAERWAAVRLGEWRATAPFHGVAGFHIWEAYSPWVKLAETVKAFLDARKNPEQLRVWVNTALGETFAERGEAPEWQRLYDRREATMQIGTPPAWAGLLIASCDVQRGGGGRIEMDVWAFGPGRRRAFVEHIEVDGSIADKNTWAKLDAAIAREWISEDGRALRLARCGIDSGDGENTMQVYAWARRHPGFVMALKGRETLAAAQAIAGPTWVDLSIGGKKLKRGVRLWTVGTSMLKMELYGQLSLEKPVDGEEYPEGYIFLPDGTTDEWIKQLVAEELRMVKLRTGGFRREWVNTRGRNEALDNAVYARAITYALGIDRWSDDKWSELRDEAERHTAETKATKKAAEGSADTSPPPAGKPDDGQWGSRGGGSNWIAGAGDGGHWL